MSTKVISVGDTVKLQTSIPITPRHPKLTRGATGEVLQVYQSGNAHVKFEGVDQVVHVLAEEMEKV